MGDSCTGPNIVAFVLLSTVLASSARAQDLAVEQRTADNAVYLELGGNAGWYTINYERYLRPDASVRVGLMYMSISASAGDSSANASWLAVPIMFNYLGVSAGGHALELGGGIEFMHISAGVSTFDATADASGVIPVGTATVGYRYASTDGGFLFRVGYTPLIFVTTNDKGVFHWGGMSFGYRF